MDENEAYLLANKQRLMSQKDSDRRQIEVTLPATAGVSIDAEVDRLSQTLEMDRMDVEAGLLESGVRQIKNALERKGKPYMKMMSKKIDDARSKGKHRRAAILARQMVA